MLDRESVTVVHGLGQHPRVAPARSVGRYALFDDHDLRRWVELLEKERGPDAGESRSHDATSASCAPSSTVASRGTRRASQ